MLLKEIRNIYRQELREMYPQEEIDTFFHLLVEHYLGLERFILAIQPNLIISKEAEQPLFEALAQLKSACPIQYVMGKTEFMDLEFNVDENVLIPRPETEELVRWMLDCLSEPIEKKRLRILDIGTGSGCIAVSLAKNLPDALVHGWDVSGAALVVAEQNAKAHDVRVFFKEVDILDLTLKSVFQRDIPVSKNAAEAKAKAYGTVTTSAFDKFDVIVSNPPYVREIEKKEMHKNVTEHEPEQALFVSDHNPLQFYKAIARFAHENLKADGILFLEINQYLSQETVRLLRDSGFSHIELRKDILGNDRMIKCTLSAKIVKNT